MKTRIPAVLLMATVAVVYAVDTGSQGGDGSTEVQSLNEASTDTRPAAAAASDPVAVSRPLREAPMEGFKADNPPAITVGEPTEVQARAQPIPVSERKEQVWTEISDAISGLNKLVGDDLFKGLERQSGSEMRVMVNPDYWSRVRYETRVELKTDISKIWHLYAQQYNDSTASSVFFVDAESGKTIDIYTLATQ